MEVKPMARTWHYICPEISTAIKVEHVGLFKNTRAVATAEKKVVLAVNHLDTCQQGPFKQIKSTTYKCRTCEYGLIGDSSSGEHLHYGKI